MQEDYPANLANYMDGLIIKHWVSLQVEKKADPSDPSRVTKFVCLFYFNFLIMLIEVIQIFNKVIGFYMELENARESYISSVPSKWYGVYPLLPKNLNTLITNSNHWKTLIR
jgi:hypothetical protein